MRPPSGWDSVKMLKQEPSKGQVGTRDGAYFQQGDKINRRHPSRSQERASGARNRYKSERSLGEFLTPFVTSPWSLAGLEETTASSDIASRPLMTIRTAATPSSTETTLMQVDAEKRC